MSERTITIPYEEYQELRRFRDFADDSQDTVVVEKRQDGMGYSQNNGLPILKTNT